MSWLIRFSFCHQIFICFCHHKNLFYFCQQQVLFYFGHYQAAFLVMFLLTSSSSVVAKFVVSCYIFRSSVSRAFGVLIVFLITIWTIWEFRIFCWHLSKMTRLFITITNVFEDRTLFFNKFNIVRLILTCGNHQTLHFI